MNVSAGFIKRPIGTTLLAIALLLVGIAVFPLLPVAPSVPSELALPLLLPLPLPPVEPVAPALGRFFIFSGGVLPGFTTKTKSPCVPVSIAAVGITVALCRSLRIRRTFTNWLVNSELSALSKTAFSLAVPVVVSI